MLATTESSNTEPPKEDKKSFSKMTPEQESLMKAISSNDFKQVDAMLRTTNVKMNFVDENGMSPLENACYKGNYNICRLLLERGADANSSRHVHGYTPLMFAAIGGHVRVVHLLLEHGANVDAVNSVGRTASQMAAFVGQHKAVTVINSFVPRDSVEYYAKIQGLEKEPRLSPHLVDSFLNFVQEINVNPVRVAMNWVAKTDLVEHTTKVRKVLDLMCEREMKKDDPNESLAFKFHFLSFIVKHIQEFLSSSEATKKDDGSVDLTPLFRKWLRGDVHGFPVTLERLLRQSIREFPYHDCALFIQLVKTLSSVEVGQEPSAITILAKSINGQKGFDEDAPVCSTCGESNPPKKCSQCKSADYCDQMCQKIHWFDHKKICLQLKQERELEKSMSTTNVEDQ